MKICAMCSTLLTGRQQRYCSQPCATKGFTAARKADGRLKKPPELWARCADCEKPIRQGATTCRPCHMRRKRAAAKRRAAVRRLEVAALGTRGTAPFIQGVCARCGRGFARKGAASPYCCSYCSKRAKKRGGAKFIGARARLAIYIRDGWICQICREPVDREAHSLDDWAPSLDHIVPQCKGGTHHASNLRLAHRWCNSVIADGAYYTATDLAAA